MPLSKGLQCIRLEKIMTDFKSYSKKMPVPFEIYDDFESDFKKC